MRARETRRTIATTQCRLTGLMLIGVFPPWTFGVRETVSGLVVTVAQSVPCFSVKISFHSAVTTEEGRKPNATSVRAVG
ncbi:hypothetical protein FB45DRAFT_910543 [Roridomyces roridus]|uniref:Uncharacterized protein n=1 Tax=Roridomyces roridus TaxID=1738132 RepID=A0AAD7FS55_9AGAR|nr:hypothetical protein FB45DRAFT_910543 [Roridomyces roridus]